MVDFSDNHINAAKAADRTEEIRGQNWYPEDRLSFIMDLMAADGENGNSPLDWDRLLNADDFNFSHDAFGISRHMNRVTGELMNFFLPRFAMSEGK